MPLIAALAAIFLLAACGRAARSSYTTKNGVQVDTSEADWMAKEEAEVMEDLLIDGMIKLGYPEADVRRQVATARVRLVTDRFPCGTPTACDSTTGKCPGTPPMGECRGSAGWNGRESLIVLAEEWCVYRSSYVHELAHAILFAYGWREYQHEHVPVWHLVNDIRSQLMPWCLGFGSAPSSGFKPQREAGLE